MLAARSDCGRPSVSRRSSPRSSGLKETSKWLDTPTDAFGGLEPLEVIERVETDRPWNMIYDLESGVPS